MYSPCSISPIRPQIETMLTNMTYLLNPHLNRPLALFLLSLLGLVLLGCFGLLERLSQQLVLPEFVIIVAVMLIASTGFIHIPIWRTRRAHTQHSRRPSAPFLPARTLISLSFGGALLPMIYSLLLIVYLPISLWTLMTLILITTAFSYALSFPIPGFGIGIPLFSTPVVSALASYLMLNEHVVSSAYIAATIGVMLGADVFRFNDIKRLGVDRVCIGGAGIIDSIVLTGFISAVLILFF